MSTPIISLSHDIGIDYGKLIRRIKTAGMPIITEACGKYRYPVKAVNDSDVMIIRKIIAHEMKNSNENINIPNDSSKNAVNEDVVKPETKPGFFYLVIRKGSLDPTDIKIGYAESKEDMKLEEHILVKTWSCKKEEAVAGIFEIVELLSNR